MSPFTHWDVSIHMKDGTTRLFRDMLMVVHDNPNIFAYKAPDDSRMIAFPIYSVEYVDAKVAEDE